LVQIKGGDDRFYNNMLIGPIGSLSPGKASSTSPKSQTKDPEWGGGFGLWVYDFRELPLQTGGNVFYNSARPYVREQNPAIEANDPKLRLVQQGRFELHLVLGQELKQTNTRLVTTALLGKAKIPQLAYEQADGSPLKLDADYFGKPRNKTHPTPGPFENPGSGDLTFTLK